MKITILGCGEAFDERLPNTSVLVESGRTTVLLDCGYSVPRQLWSHVPDPSSIDIIYISHPHADHYFGIPALLGRMWEDGREKPLTIVTQPAVIDQLKDVGEYGYRGLASRYKYPIQWTAARPGTPIEAGGLQLDFAETLHSVPNLAVQIRKGSGAFCYSGDGMFTDATRKLFRDADFVIHEAYWFEETPIHADIPRLIDMAFDEHIKRMALVHVHRGLRQHPEPLFKALGKAQPGVLFSLPEPLERYEVGT